MALNQHQTNAGRGFHLRAGTNDALIYEQVVIQNEYLLPARLGKGSVVLDIGAHIGTFSYLALERGAAAVIGFEPEVSNHACAEFNLARFGNRAQVHQLAAWRSDVAAGTVPFLPSGDQLNSGGGSVIWEADETVQAIAFDDIVDALTSQGRRRIDLLKMDCEGAEFPILMTSKRLHCIDHIVGEFHELRGGPLPEHVRIPGSEDFAADGLAQVLRRDGFAVAIERRATATFGDLGLFFAHRVQ